MKLRSRRLMVFNRNFCKIRQIWVSEPHFAEARDDARPWLMARWKAYGRLSIRVNWTFSLTITVLELWGGFAAPLYKFYLDTVVPHQPFLVPERYWATRWRRLHPSAFPRFDTIPECDGRTDRRTEGYSHML